MAANRKRRRAPKRGTAEMTEFGKTLHRLMVAHEVYEWKDLIRLLKEKAGYEIGQPRLSSYLYGDRNPRHLQRFFDAVAVALDLDEEAVGAMRRVIDEFLTASELEAIKRSYLASEWGDAWWIAYDLQMHPYLVIAALRHLHARGELPEPSA